MDKYYFDVVGDFAANDLMGVELAGEDEAHKHAVYIAGRLAVEKPELVKPGNYVVVRDEATYEVFRLPIAPHLQPVR